MVSNHDLFPGAGVVPMTLGRGRTSIDWFNNKSIMSIGISDIMLIKGIGSQENLN